MFEPGAAGADEDQKTLFAPVDLPGYPCIGEVGIWNVGVDTCNEPLTVGLFGDSITQMSFYSDALQEILYEKYPGRITFLNGGISGNRLLYDTVWVPERLGNGRMFGEAGARRFERDLYVDTAPDIIFAMEGVNDCTHALLFNHPEEVPDGEMLWKGL